MAFSTRYSIKTALVCGVGREERGKGGMDFDIYREEDIWKIISFPILLMDDN